MTLSAQLTEKSATDGFIIVFLLASLEISLSGQSIEKSTPV